MTQRKLIDRTRDKRYVRRNERGQFKEVDDVGRSLAADRRRRAKTRAKPGEGDKGDRPRPNRKAGSKGRKTSAGGQGTGRKAAGKRSPKR